MQLGEKIYYHRVKKGITQSELCRGICSISYLSKIENNKIEASSEVIELLFSRLGIEGDSSQLSSSELRRLLNEWYAVMKERDSRKASDLWNELSSLVEKADDPLILCLFNLYSSRYYMLQKDLVKAKECLKEAENMEKLFSEELNYYYHSFHGLLKYLEGHLEDALEEYKKAERCSGIANIIEPEFVYQLSIVNSRLGKNLQSILSAQTALTEFDKNANYERSVDCHILIGICYIRIGDYDNAEHHLTNALNAIRILPDSTILKSRIYHNLALLHSKKKHHMKALEFLFNSLELDNKLYLHRVYLIAKQYYELENLSQAQYWINKGIEEEGKPSTFLYKLKILDSSLKKDQGKEEYVLLLKEALNFFKLKKDRMNMHMCYEKLGDYYAGKFSYKDASEAYAMANKIQIEMR
ncbi:helix-turn-helix domain-containing protein [Rossellomorea aquimaris]|uniref:Helix-turn-helix protein n=1 Tax=Rossellomorea aquimaris TaxID=189382 RepID=A0A366EJF7_9BACI|nr:helix-turn-helix domain-containing protein [Rossellomorea aquimaris]RBP02488.1 helix-turn-helix protein [Rossellomorea aquimaris]